MTQTELNKTQREVVCDAAAPEPYLVWKYEFNEQTGEYEYNRLELSDGSKFTLENIHQTIKRSTGARDAKIGEKILNRTASGMAKGRTDQKLNEVSALLPALQPQDEAEAMLLGQFLALQDSGTKCLNLANVSEQGFYHVERFFLLANKLLSTANQTMQTVLKYRSRGQQTVQVVHVHNEGQAIVAQNLAAPAQGEGLSKKNVN